MKKLLLFIFALCTVSGAWADDPVNLVSGKSAVIDNTATGNTYTDAQRLLITNGVKSNSEDANVNLKLSKQNANNTIDWFYIDMEASKTPKYVAITWTNCRPTSYDIYLSSEVPTTSNYGTKVFTQSSAPDGGAVTTTHTLSGDISGRYISFVPAQASLNGWGCFMSEFEVYEAYDQILSGISSQDGYKIWNMQYHVPATAVDQYGRIFEGETTWTLPSYATKVSGGFDYSADVITGVYTLTMSSNDNPSQTASKKYAILRNAPTTDDVPAIDQDNAIIIYSGETNKQAGEVAGSWKNPNSKGWNKLSIGDNNGWFVNNFGTFGLKDTGLGTDASEIQALYLDIYSLDNHSGTVEIEGSGLASNPAFNLVPGWNHIAITVNTTIATSLSPSQAVIIHLNEATNKAIDEDLVIYNVYFSKVAPDPDDDVKPVMVSAALASKTHNSATLTLEATDNNSKVKFHIVDATNSINVTTGLADQGKDFEYTVTGLTAETAYNFTVTAEDAAGNVSENYIVMDGFTTDAAPADTPNNLPNDPAHLETNVKSVFGYYGKKAGIGYANGAQEQTIKSENDVIKFTNGVPYIHNIGLNVSDMDYLHLDVWTYPTTTMAVFVQDGVKMIAPDEQTVETGEWKSIDIPLTFFTDNGMNLENVTIIQFGKTVGDKTNHVGMSNFDDDNNAYIANIYFYKAETVNVADASGLATYVSTSDLNYGAVDGLTAYKANVNVSEGSLEFTEVDNVPSGEGVLLKSENGSGTFIIPYAEVDDWAADYNAFVQGTGSAIPTEDGFGGYNYILSKVSGVVGFYYANGRNVATNRAYINTTYGGPYSPELTMVFHEDAEEDTSNETDGINKITPILFETNAAYNLAGQRVSNDYKGIVVVNGKKYLRK